MIDIQEPLFGGAKNQGIFTSPAMRVAMRVLARMEQRAIAAQVLDDRRVSLEYVLSSPLTSIGGKNSFVVNWSEWLKPILRAHHEVLVTMTGSSMDQTRTGISRHVVAVH